MAINPNPNYRKNIKPGLSVPAGLSPELEKFLQGVKEHLQGADGTRGQPKERFVTLEDLERIGLITAAVKNGRGIIKSLNVTAGTDLSDSAATQLATLSDVDAAAAESGDVLRYNASQSEWVAGPFFDETGIAQRDYLPGEVTYSDEDETITGTWTFTRVIVSDVDFTNAASLTADLDTFTDVLQGVVPASGGGTANFLRADGSWSPAGGGGGGGTLVYVNTSVPAGNTVANTTNETAFDSSYTFATDRLEQGHVIRLRAAGVISTDGASAPDITFNVNLGGSARLTFQVTLPTGLADAGWLIDATMAVFTDGATGTVDAQGLLLVDDTPYNLANSAAAGIDTTATALVSVSVTWSAADADNTVTLRELVVSLDGVDALAPADATFITATDQTSTLANSRHLIAGTNITLDTSVAGDITISALGGGASEAYPPQLGYAGVL